MTDATRAALEAEIDELTRPPAIMYDLAGLWASRARRLAEIARAALAEVAPAKQPTGFEVAGTMYYSTVEGVADRYVPAERREPASSADGMCNCHEPAALWSQHVSAQDDAAANYQLLHQREPASTPQEFRRRPVPSGVNEADHREGASDAVEGEDTYRSTGVLNGAVVRQPGETGTEPPALAALRRWLPQLKQAADLAGRKGFLGTENYLKAIVGEAEALLKGES